MIELKPISLSIVSLSFLKLTNGEGRTIDRERGDDDVDAAAVGEARIADGACFVDAPADLRHDALTDVQQLIVVAEPDICVLHLAVNFDVGRLGAVHHDIGDVVAGQQRLERAVAQNVVADVLQQVFLLGDRHHDILDGDDLVDDIANLVASAVPVKLRQLGQVDGVDQRVKDRRLDIVVFVRAAFGGELGLGLLGLGGLGRRCRRHSRSCCRRRHWRQVGCWFSRGRMCRRGRGRRSGRRRSRLRRRRFGVATFAKHQLASFLNGSFPSNGARKDLFSFGASSRPHNWLAR